MLNNTERKEDQQMKRRILFIFRQLGHQTDRSVVEWGRTSEEKTPHNLSGNYSNFKIISRTWL